MKRFEFGLAIALPSIAVSALGCSTTGQEELTYRAFATPVVRQEIQAGGFTLTIERATIAFGPVYFCAAATGSSTLCETAIGEIRKISVIDALDARPQAIGDVHGFQGTIRSASYDHGIHWFLTESSATADEAAPMGHSAVFLGKARKGNIVLDFEAHVDVVPSFQGQRAVTRMLTPVTIEDDNVQLEMEIDIAQWLSAVDFDKASTAVGERLLVQSGSTDHSGIVIAMTSSSPPTFSWKMSDLENP